MRRTAPAATSTHHGARRTHTLPVAATTSVDPTPAGTTLSASDDVPPTPVKRERQESAGVPRPLMQLLPIVAICLAIGLVVLVSAARRGSRRTQGPVGRGRRRHHRHASSDVDELVHPRV